MRYERIVLWLAVLALTSCGDPEGGPDGGPLAPSPHEVTLAGKGGGGGGGGSTVDRDADGLPDALEATLVAQYRPYFFVDQAETIRSLSVTDWAMLGGFNAYRSSRATYSHLASLQTAVSAFPNGWLNLPAGLVAGRAANAPLYVEAVPMPPGYAIEGKSNLVWLHYWLLFGDDVKVYLDPKYSHRGDWEHVCVMVERSAAGQPEKPPVMIHWHHHARADIAPTAHAWHSDSRGSFHPRAYIEAGGHAMYRVPGTFPGEHDDSAGSTDNPLDNPLVFLREHEGQAGTAAAESKVVRTFLGRWGQTASDYGLSPRGPLAWNTPCDRDYTTTPTAASFALANCQGF